MIETRDPSRPHWYQFRLRTLLAGMAVIGVLLLAARWYVEPFRHQRKTMELIQSLGGSYETSPPQKWQAWYFGGDYQNLIHVNLADCDQTDRYVAAVAGLPRLETLVVGGESFGDEQLQQLRQLSSLHVLILDPTSVSDDALASFRERSQRVEVYPSQRRAIAALRKRSFGVAGRPGTGPTTPVPNVGAEYFEQPEKVRPGAFIDDDALALLAKVKGFKLVDFNDTQVGDAGLKQVQRMTGLQQLLAGNSSQVTDVGLMYLEGLRNLEILYLRGTGIKGQGLAHLGGLRNLRILNLSDDPLGDEGLPHIRNLTNLERLNLSSTHVGDAGMASLSGMTKLKELLLDSTHVGDDGLAHLKGLTNLERLDLSSARVSDTGMASLSGLNELNKLSLDRTRVGNDALSQLKRLPNLGVLSLKYTSVTDAGLAHLKGLSKLQQLNLRETKVTRAGVEELRKALPGCTILGP